MEFVNFIDNILGTTNTSTKSYYARVISENLIELEFDVFKCHNTSFFCSSILIFYKTRSFFKDVETDAKRTIRILICIYIILLFRYKYILLLLII